ncbi:adenosylmethionine--8-amino-7-oxononanoate transaminase [Deinococcus hopiensis]|uniref:Adenosylmethionine-8-amino-7-oxononanoate aminotransferase n=1 Tax=Deinococcus hopiensis KR-140 TaxID=695939 RepID=A0A1W1VR19_9DEIO|nr:adenosylmethionine--8-amino-7-oxononanoate transaminase [Deinococcus hopiensis]SMB95541.1 adenosylmethionine-8-amino-7-oxononanoate aminotransferase [Deinococcus hopiensis KR-140]
MRAEDLLFQDARHVWHPFTQASTAPTPIAIARGEGPYLITADGERLLDLISSWWVNLHGHAHPHIAAAIARQAGTLEQVIFAGFTHAPAVTLATRLAERLPGGLSRIFFSDNGSTAVEAALKIALQACYNRGEGQRRRILALEGGYHGDTFGAMSAGQSSGFYAPFADKLFDVTFLPYPETWADDADVEAKEAQALATLNRVLDEQGGETAALLLEPLLQGSTGMRLCRPAFLNEVVRRVRARGILVIFDEVMTGFFRMGRMWAAEHLTETPDLVCLSKGLTGGFLPMGITACTQPLYEAFQGDTFDRAFAHGHSYTANPLACAAALASLELLETAQTRQSVARIGETHARWQPELSAHPNLEHARGLGTVAAVNLRGAGGYGGDTSLRLRQFFLERGLLLRPLGNVLYLLPPYCVEDEHLDAAYRAVLDAAQTFGGPS